MHCKDRNNKQYRRNPEASCAVDVSIHLARQLTQKNIPLKLVKCNYNIYGHYASKVNRGQAQSHIQLTVTIRIFF